MTIGEKIKARRLELGLTLEDVGNYVGVGKSTVRKWEVGIIENIRRDKLAKLAEILKMSPVEFIFEEVTKKTRLEQALTIKGISQAELCKKTGIKKSAMSQYVNGIIEPAQDKVFLLADALNVHPAWLMGYDVPIYNCRIDNIEPLPEFKSIPLLGSIACGEPILAEENIEYLVRADKTLAVDFALRCVGDSMINARIFNGDIVFIRQQPDVDDGDIAAVLIGNEATLKKVHKFPGKLVLSPCNPLYDDLIYTGEQLDDVRILGKAVAFISAVR